MDFLEKRAEIKKLMLHLDVLTKGAQERAHQEVGEVVAPEVLQDGLQEVVQEGLQMVVQGGSRRYCRRCWRRGCRRAGRRRYRSKNNNGVRWKYKRRLPLWMKVWTFLKIMVKLKSDL